MGAEGEGGFRSWCRKCRASLLRAAAFGRPFVARVRIVCTALPARPTASRVASIGGLAGAAVGLDHPADDLAALALAVGQLVQQLACQVEDPALRVGHGADGRRVGAANVPRGADDLAREVDCFSLASLNLVDQLAGNAVATVVGRLGGVQERFVRRR